MLLPGTRLCSHVLWMTTLFHLTFRAWTSGATNCPRMCFCNVYSKIVYCSRRGLPYIPDGIPRDSQQLNLNGNVFKTSAIRRSNFSRFDKLEHLYLSECGIETIEVDTFIDLTKLQWLDLSDNRIKTVEDYTFRGLNLKHLFLNGNHQLRLRRRSFEELKTTGLYLPKCNLKKISVDVLAPLNNTLRKLWLDNNNIERLDKKLLPLFKTLSHMRLGKNPLHCNCEVLWLKEFYDRNVEKFKGAVPASCASPGRVRGKYFNEMSLSDFRCQAPTFNNIDAMFEHNTGRLRCTATGDPAPMLFWIKPTGESNKYIPPNKDDAKHRHNEGVLRISEAADDISGQYICLAYNEAGNVTLTINVSWPKAKSTIVSYIESKGASTTTTTTTGSNHRASHPERLNRTHPSTQNMLNYSNTGERMFNLTELVGAVIGTHVCTLLLCLIFMPIYYKRKWRDRNPEKPVKDPYMSRLPDVHDGLPALDYCDSPKRSVIYMDAPKR